MFPSAPWAIPRGVDAFVGVAYSVITPLVVILPILPILSPLASVNYMLPSGPRVMEVAHDPAVGIGNSVMAPVGVMRLTRFPVSSINHIFPSAPLAIPCGLELA